MIAYIKGIIGELIPTEVVIEAAGVGYGLTISLNTFANLQGKESAKVYVKEVIREDAHDLYGFSSKQERTLFEALTSVNGIGGQTARMVLSAFTPAELAEVIQSEQTAMLKSVKGIGPKAAARIVLDLRDKVSALLGDGQLDVTPTGGGHCGGRQSSGRRGHFGTDHPGLPTGSGAQSRGRTAQSRTGLGAATAHQTQLERNQMTNERCR